MILGRDPLTELGLNLKNSEHVMKAYDNPFMGYTAPMVDLGAYIFTNLNTGEIKHGESFTVASVKEVYKSESIYTATKILRVILYAKYEKADLHEVM